jgi:NAD(P)-dependent dehydrogenase (short-subunit alcohol dehydrogenase family)
MGSSASIEVNKYGFSKTSTADEVASKFPDQCRGITVVVTGANTGLGFETSRVLAKYGATVILASRTLKNGEAAVSKIKQEMPNADVSTMELDLGSLKSVKAFAEAYLQTGKPLHVLINNAGVMACPKLLTADGMETQFGVNHIGHFYLTELLLPRLASTGTAARPARVVNLSSMGNWIFSPTDGIRFDDLVTAEKGYDAWERYGMSKLANILFSKELNRRMKAESKPVISVSLHPGVIMESELSRHFDTMTILSFFMKTGRRFDTFWASLTQYNKNIAQGSSTSILCALDPDIIPAEHYDDCDVAKVMIHDKACDEELAKKLWTFSEELVASKIKNN